VELLFKDEVYSIVGAAFEVYNTLGPGFLEAVYHEALAVEFTERHIPFSPKKPLQITYKGRVLEKSYIPDFVCHGAVVVEIKALNQLTSTDQAQLLNYLTAARMTIGLLINFGSARTLQWKRMALSHSGQPGGNGLKSSLRTETAT
jgi:GxxExxY protein